jgi:hypothetical protein
MDATALFQRTEIGRETIHTKNIKLTQSERLVLILSDGATVYSELRKKVWALSDERFARALSNLLEKDMIYEVLIPLEGQHQETLDQTIVDRFLQQDPLDPVSIIVFDPEDEFGTDLIEAAGFRSVPAETNLAQGVPPNVPPVTAVATPTVAGTGDTVDVAGLEVATPECAASETIVPVNVPPAEIVVNYNAQLQAPTLLDYDDIEDVEAEPVGPISKRDIRILSDEYFDALEREAAHLLPPTNHGKSAAHSRSGSTLQTQRGHLRLPSSFDPVSAAVASPNAARGQFAAKSFALKTKNARTPRWKSSEALVFMILEVMSYCGFAVGIVIFTFLLVRHFG